jgi:hypothetical protein
VRASDGKLVACPENRNDETVKSCQEMFLCEECSAVRFPALTAESVSNTEVDLTTVAATGITEVCCELLYFVQNKCDVLHVNAIVNICVDFYTDAEIEAARLLLIKVCKKRLIKHKGTDEEKRKRTVQDIVQLCLDPHVPLPVFYSVKMGRVPPVGIEHIDISSLLLEVSALRAEVRSLTTVRSEVAAISESVKAMRADAAMKPISTLAVQEAVIVVDASSDTTGGISQSPAVSADMDPKQLHQDVPPTVHNVLPVGPAAAVATYASIAGQIKAGDMKNKVSRKMSSTRPVVGSSTNNNRLKSVSLRKTVDIFVTRLQPNTDISEVSSCAEDILDTGSSNNYNVNCFKLNSKRSDVYSSFHVSVSVDAADMKLTVAKLIAADSWPSGILVRRYFTPKNG